MFETNNETVRNEKGKHRNHMAPKLSLGGSKTLSKMISKLNIWGLKLKPK